jgi:hypothetical protein
MSFGVTGWRASLCAGKALSLKAFLVLHCWKAECKREKPKQEEDEEKEKASWFSAWNGGGIYSLEGVVPLQ